MLAPMRFRSLAIFSAAALVLGLALAATVFAKIPHRATEVIVQTSQVKGKRMITAAGGIDSPLRRCERQRDVVLYLAGADGTLAGPPLARAVSAGGGGGQWAISAKTAAKIQPTTEFLVVAEKRRVKVKGKKQICKRGVSVTFPGNFP
jgi:hypothetical protein